MCQSPDPGMKIIAQLAPQDDLVCQGLADSTRFRFSTKRR